MLGTDVFELSSGARHSLDTIFLCMATVHDRENGNGRAVRNLLERAKRAQALRLMELGGKRTKEELTLLTEDDFYDSLSELKPPPGGGGLDGPDGPYEPDGYQMAVAYA